MTTATDSFSIEPGAEPLPGYRLEKRIGSGGYGDVWKAIAPGGLPKAIKIIHGEVDGDRAVRELRSLDRAKSLNHPFLLSIERIEIVDRHLLMVTELADATLRDRFEQCRAEGLPGIPRDELFDYMREAADALDYLFDCHSLQHLDIKPENLLLRAKHVKVADFGLLKNLQESCASLVSGMTPKYSVPELFEGRPGRHSDQYSLAIVFHEMVSGGLPFSGSNIASLASQHLHAAPDLSALVPVERFAVGKALLKIHSTAFQVAEHLSNDSGIAAHQWLCRIGRLPASSKTAGNRSVTRRPVQTATRSAMTGIRVKLPPRKSVTCLG